MFRRRKTVPLVFPNMAQTQHVHLRKMLKSKMKYQLQPPTRSIWPTQKGRLSYSCIKGSHTSFYPEDGLMSSYLHLFCPLIFGLTNFWEKKYGIFGFAVESCFLSLKDGPFSIWRATTALWRAGGFEKGLQVFSSFREHTSFPAPFMAPLKHQYSILRFPPFNVTCSSIAGEINTTKPCRAFGGLAVPASIAYDFADSINSIRPQKIASQLGGANCERSLWSGKSIIISYH